MRYTTLLICSLILFIGCSPSVRVTRYVSDIYPPTTKVEVLRTKPPETKYIELAELEVDSHDDAIEELVKKAKGLGANAIILMGERGKGAIAMPMSGLVIAVPLTKLWAVAIRYE